MELLFTTAYYLSSASEIKIFSLTASLKEIPVLIPVYRYSPSLIRYQNTSIAKQHQYWRPCLPQQKIFWIITKSSTQT